VGTLTAGVLELHGHGRIQEEAMIRGIDHIELIVRDVDEFIAFFQQLGFQLLTRTSHHGASAELQLPGPHQPIFEIHQVSGEENIGINHIAFKVDNAEETYEELRSKGITSLRAPNFVTATGRTTVNFRDPDGWRLQLVDADRKKPV
jgi:catechol 2,3-dioxygenase-like lactoylglutathione lyase family enzyme